MATIKKIKAQVSVSGWLKLHRQLQDNPLWLSEPFSRGQAWVDLMMLANYRDGYIRVRGRRVDVQAGCVARSQNTLATRWQWSRGKVIRFLKELESDGQISQETGHDFNVITICNYKEYQDDSTRDESRDGTRNRSRGSTRDGPVTVHETVHIKEQQQGKEEQEEKETPPSAEAMGGELVDDVVISFPAKGGGTSDITTQLMERYRENYPNLDVMAQLRSMRQHLEDNPHKRQPEWGYKTFISNWLNNRVGDMGRAAQEINTHGNFTPERYAIDDTARKFTIAGGGL